MKLSDAIALTERVAWRGKSNGAKAARCARVASSFFGPNVLIEEIKTAGLDKFAGWLESTGRSDATINRYLSYLSRVFTEAERREILTKKPHFPFRLAGDNARTRVLSKAEEKTLLATINPLSRDVVVVLLDTGMRSGEVFRIRASDCNFQLRMIHVWKTKTGKPRSVPMTPRVYDILVNRVTPKGDPKPALLFPAGAWQFVHHWRQARDAMGLAGDRHFVPHMLRHTCATRLLAGGANIATVKQWLGHATIRTTERYVHMSDMDLRNAAQFLEG